MMRNRGVHLTRFGPVYLGKFLLGSFSEKFERSAQILTMLEFFVGAPGPLNLGHVSLFNIIDRSLILCTVAKLTTFCACYAHYASMRVRNVLNFSQVCRVFRCRSERVLTPGNTCRRVLQLSMTGIFSIWPNKAHYAR